MTKWHDYRICWKQMLKARGLGKHLDKSGLAVLLNELYDENKKRNVNTCVQLVEEFRWQENGRPYYDVYPTVVQPFTKVDLDKVDSALLRLPLPQLVLRFQVGHEFQASPKTKIRSIFFCEQEGPPRAWLMAFDDGSILGRYMDGEDSKRPLAKEVANIPIHTITAVRMVDGQTIQQHLDEGRLYPYAPRDVNDVDEEAVDNCYRLIATLCLLKGDPDLIEEQPLTEDVNKWLATHDPKLIAKAAKRGKRAWSVGSHIEVQPGFRRPHFAIRWCGKGRTDPRLRPIKGCLIHRKVITAVPTDYLDKEE